MFPLESFASSRVQELAGLSVCLVGINYAPDSTGIAPYNSAMAGALKDAGAEVHVVTGIPHYPQWKVHDSRYLEGSRWEENLDGVRVTRVRHHVPPTATLRGRARMEASFLARATPVVRQDRSHSVIAVTPSLSGLAAAVYGRRNRPLGAVVQDLTGNAAEQSGSAGGRLARSLARREYSLLRRAGRVGVVTPQFGRILRDHGIESDRIVDLPNFTHITPAALSPAAARQALGWPSQGYTVVHTGNMGMKQGLESVLEAARVSERERAGVSFVLVGDGNQRDRLELASRGLSTLRFVDPLDSDTYPLALAAADALLINERPGVLEMSMPSKLTSYSSAGRPIIAAVDRAGITFNVIRDYNAALVVSPGDGKALVEAAIYLRSDERAASRIAGAAQQMRQSLYNSDHAKARYVQFAKLLWTQS